ncbi:hypothetical protein AAVH_29389 [Aphelenchoides avenae]|nr:hypothetical protein AAVH_29389 [Aphelenchus avenae]
MLNGVDLETEELKRLLLLAKHCELTDDSGTVDWPRVRMYFYLYLRERLTCKRLLDNYEAVSRSGSTSPATPPYF